MVSLSFFPSWCHGFLIHLESVCYAYNVAIAIWPTDRQWMRGGKHGSLEKHGGRDSTKGVFSPSFHRKRLRWRLQTFAMAVANVCDGGCKRLRERMQTFAVADANVYDGGCKRLRERMQTLAVKREVHCKGGCSALRERLQCTEGAVAVH